MVRMQPDLLQRLDIWIEAHGPGHITRPQAIRTLLDEGLAR
jgi:hypothetical protein